MEKDFPFRAVKIPLVLTELLFRGFPDKGLLLPVHNNRNFAIIRLSAQGNVLSNSDGCSLGGNRSGHGADNRVQSVNAKPYTV